MSEKYFYYDEDQIKLYVDESDREDMDSEIYMDICLKHYPLRDWKGMWSEMHNIVKDYAKLGHRNKNAIARGNATIATVIPPMISPRKVFLLNIISSVKIMC